MALALTQILTKDAFGEASARYRRRWHIGLCAVAGNGQVVFHDSDDAWAEERFADVRRLAVTEALRWGEPAVEPAPNETVVWAVPVMLNAEVLGGLVAGIAEARLFRRGSATPVIDVRSACTDLRRLAEELNLTNPAALEIRRSEYSREQARAEAIHSLKASRHYDLRAMYLLEEPRLIASIRRGDRGEARDILNHLLVGMIHQAGDRLELAKSFFMELVAMMSRTAVESGGSPESSLGSNFASIAELGAITSEEKLAVWLHETLERVMDSIQRNRTRTPDALVAGALRYMADNCCRDIGRDEAAAAACVSPSHFSRLIRKRFGQSFTDLLNQMRIDRAVELLNNTDKPLKSIALETGFADQSYFTKVFRRWRGVPPAQFRRHQTPTSSALP